MRSRSLKGYMERLKALSTRERLVLLGALLLLFLALFLYFRSSGGGGKRPQSRQPLVKVMELKRADFYRHVVLSGKTVALAEVELSPKYTGRIESVLVNLGDRVEAGQPLLVQDDEDLDIAVLEQTAQARAAQADAREARATYDASFIKAQNDFELEQSKYERNEYLYSIGAISKDTLDSVKQEYLASRASFEILANQVEDGTAASVLSKEYAAQKAEHAASALVRERADMTLYAPRSGIIGYRHAEAGEIVSAGTKVLTLVDTSRVSVDCSISEAEAALLAPGLPVKVTIDALGRDYEATIVYVSPSMDESTKTYLARVELMGEELGVKAGLFAHTELNILQRKNTLFVPKEAVLTKNGKRSVFILRADGTAEEREVRTGLFNDESEELLGGVAEGEQVIISGLDRLQTGVAVDVAGGEP